MYQTGSWYQMSLEDEEEEWDEWQEDMWDAVA